MEDVNRAAAALAIACALAGVIANPAAARSFDPTAPPLERCCPALPLRTALALTRRNMDSVVAYLDKRYESGTAAGWILSCERKSSTRVACTVNYYYVDPEDDADVLTVEKITVRRNSRRTAVVDSFRVPRA